MSSDRYGVEAVEPLDMCFDESILPDTTNLPGHYSSDGDGEMSNSRAASRAANPPVREQELAAWGRVSGAYRLWAFTTDTASAGKGTPTVPANETREAEELLSTPVISVNCFVDLFDNVAGARLAFQTQADFQRTSLPFWPGDSVAVQVLDTSAVGDESQAFTAAHVYQGMPGLKYWVGSFRDRNAIGSVILYGGACDMPGAASCDEVLSEMEREGARMLAAYQQQFQQRLSANLQPDLLATPAPSPTSTAPRQLNPDGLLLIAPSVIDAGALTGLELTAAEARDDIDVLLKNADLDRLTSRTIVTYRTEDGHSELALGLALFDSAEAAGNVFDQIRAAAFGTDGALDTAGVGDEAVGKLVAGSPDNAPTGVVLVRVDRLLVAVMVTDGDAESIRHAVLAVAGVEAGAAAATTFIEK